MESKTLRNWPEGNILNNGFVGKQRVLLRHVAAITARMKNQLAVNDNTSTLRTLRAEQQAQQRRFAAAGLADDRYKFAFFNLKVQPGEDSMAAAFLEWKLHIDVVQGNKRHAVRSPGTRDW